LTAYLTDGPNEELSRVFASQFTGCKARLWRLLAKRDFLAGRPDFVLEPDSVNLLSPMSKHFCEPMWIWVNTPVHECRFIGHKMLHSFSFLFFIATVCTTQ
jgi:hypothetical protein